MKKILQTDVCVGDYVRVGSIGYTHYVGKILGIEKDEGAPYQLLVRHWDGVSYVDAKVSVRDCYSKVTATLTMEEEVAVKDIIHEFISLVLSYQDTDVFECKVDQFLLELRRKFGYLEKGII